MFDTIAINQIFCQSTNLADLKAGKANSHPERETFLQGKDAALFIMESNIIRQPSLGWLVPLGNGDIFRLRVGLCCWHGGHSVLTNSSILVRDVHVIGHMRNPHWTPSS